MKMIFQRVGDRDKVQFSFKKDYAFALCANPMSDRFQMVLEDEDNESQR